MPLTKITGNLIAGGSGSLVDADTVDGLNLSSTNVVSTIVARDASGDFAARNIAAQDLTLSGNLTVNGTTTTINSATLTVDDKNIELGSVATPTDTTAAGGGIVLKGASDKTFQWFSGSAAWTSSENLDLESTKTYKINGVNVLTATGLGSTVVSSSLTSVGTITSGTWSGSFGAVSGANLTSLTAGNLSGTIPSAVLGNSSHFIGTTSVTLNRASANLGLTGILSIAMPGATSGTVTLTPTAVSGTTAITIPATSGTLALTTNTLFVGTTSIALNRASANLGLTGILSIAMPGATSGTVTLTPTAVSGTTAITLPATSGTLITNNDNGTVSNTMLAGSIADSKLSQITTAGKVANSATTADYFNTANAIVTRNSSGGFWAGTITAELNGNASTANAVSAVAGSGSSVILVSANMSNNDYFRIMVGATGGDNTGFVEIATADNGSEPIYIRQYTGAAGNFNTLQRTLTLLDESGNTDVPGQLKAAKGTTTGVTAVAALNIDCSLGTFFTKTIAANSTFTVSNVPAAGTAYGFTLELTVSAGSVTWWSGVIWPSAITPTLTAGKTHLLIFVTDDGGTVWRGSFLTDYAS